MKITRYLAGMGKMGALAALGGAFLVMAAEVMAAELEPYQVYQHKWELAQYQQTGDAQEQALATLAAEVRNAALAHPEDLKLKTWAGIIIGSYAGAKGGLGALGLAKEAKSDYEAVIAKDASTLNGSALTSLGVLYYRVPGWPLGFGDEEKAAFLLKRGLNFNPDGIDSNYFYADYLISQGKPAEAKPYLQKALQAAPRPGREVADAGRQSEIQRLQQKLTE